MITTETPPILPYSGGPQIEPTLDDFPLVSIEFADTTRFTMFVGYNLARLVAARIFPGEEVRFKPSCQASAEHLILLMRGAIRRDEGPDPQAVEKLRWAIVVNNNQALFD